jgi:hypothetical protein
MKFINKKHPPKELQEMNKKYPNASYLDLGSYNGSSKLKENVRMSLGEEQGHICCYCMQPLRNYNLLPKHKEKENKRKEDEKKKKIRIEHFSPQSAYTGKKLDSQNNKLINALCDKSDKARQDLRTNYSNLLASCENDRSIDGGHCDVKKGEKELCYLLNPSIQGFKKQQRTFSYNTNGKIYSSDLCINKEIGGIELPCHKGKDKQEMLKGITDKLNLNHRDLERERLGVWNGIASKLRKAAKVKNWETKRNKIYPFAKELRDQYQKPKKDGSFYPFGEMVVHLLENKFRKLKSA